MSNRLTIRPAKESDHDDVVRLWNEAFPNDPARNHPPTVFRRKMEAQPDLFLVGHLDGRLVATVLAGYDGFRGWIYHLAVARDQRRNGLGGRIMAAAEERLRALGCPKINLQVRSHNREVVEFYRSLGYAIEDHVSLGKQLIVPDE